MPAELKTTLDEDVTDSAQLAGLIHSANVVIQRLAERGLVVQVRVCNARSLCSDVYSPKIEAKVLREV